MPLSLNQNASAWKYQCEPLALMAVYHLAPRNEDGVCKVASCLPAKGIVHLLQNTYAPYLVDGTIVGKQFAELSELANVIQVKELDRPNDLTTLDQVCALVHSDFNLEIV